MLREHEIIEFEEKYREEVLHLWEICDLTRPWNDPGRDIDRNMADPNGKIFLLKRDHRVIGSVMTGYDGHRGWVYYLSVHPDFRKGNLGRMLMTRSEEYLRTLGCPKLNLMVRNTNSQAVSFYDRLGYQKDEVVVLSKRLTTDR